MNIQRGQNNTIALTLRELAEDSDSDFIIEFTNDITGERDKRVVPVIETETGKRATVFNITESDTENIQAAVVKLNPPGQWTYTAYEMAPSSPRNLNVSEAIKVVESGRCLVEGEETTYEEFNTDEDKNTAVFE